MTGIAAPFTIFSPDPLSFEQMEEVLRDSIFLAITCRSAHLGLFLYVTPFRDSAERSLQTLDLTLLRGVARRVRRITISLHPILKRLRADTKSPRNRCHAVTFVFNLRYSSQFKLFYLSNTTAQKTLS